MPRRVDEDNGAASEAVVLWRAGDSSAGQDGRPEACYARRVVRRSAVWVCAALTTSACVSAAETPASTLADAAALILVRVGPDDATDLQVIEPFDPSEQHVLTAVGGERHTYVLAYDRPLSTYGLRVEAGELVQRPDGAPLPPPTRWLEAMPEGPLAPRSTLDTARDLPDIRVPRIACPMLDEDTGRRFVPTAARGVTFVGPAGPGQHLVALARVDDPPTPAELVLVVGENDRRALDLYLATDARGVVAHDGSIWLAADVASSTTSSATPSLCHFAVGGPYDTTACRPTLNARYPLESMASSVAPDGRTIIVGLSASGHLGRWQEGRDDAAWSWIDAGRPSLFPCNAASPAALWVDGAGAGIAAPPSGYLSAFDFSRGSTTALTQLFDVPTCRGAFARTPGGRELYGRLTSDLSTELYWRNSATAEWSSMPLPTPAFDPRGMLAIGETVLVTSEFLSVTAMVFDPARPDLAPRACPAVPVYNTGELMIDLGEDRVLIGGGLFPAPFLLGAVGTWRLVE